MNLLAPPSRNDVRGRSNLAKTRLTGEFSACGQSPRPRNYGNDRCAHPSQPSGGRPAGPGSFAAAQSLMALGWPCSLHFKNRAENKAMDTAQGSTTFSGGPEQDGLERLIPGRKSAPIGSMISRKTFLVYLYDGIVNAA
ncbi:hypothetical protein [Paracoccus sp. (in: a-proteobacteria)]|uniref:hypothetical protein n=1 Tax=Paracoccus sp. TaxID=267 RepID=UPI002AFEA963|nr:hypothetical protein [Paracoccus sp. (in: a-proteobacteria)]